MSSSRLTKAVLFFLIGAIGLLMYVPTLHPSISWYNSGEFAVAALNLDVPHPPGYPLFTRFANLATRLPIGHDPAWRVNLLAALFGSFGCGIFALWLFETGTSFGVSLSSGLWLLSFGTFWEEATIGEVYTFEIFLLALFLWISWRCREGPISSGKSFALGLLCTMACGNRPTFVLFLPVLFLFLRQTGFRDRVDRQAIHGLLFGVLVGLLPLVDLYFRLQSPDRVLLDPMTGRGLEGFWRVATAADYRKGLGVFSPVELLARFKHWLFLMAESGNFLILGFPVLFLIQHSCLETPPGLACLWIVLVNTAFILNYNAFETHTMLLPSMLGIVGLFAILLKPIKTHRKALEGLFLAAVVTSIFLSGQNLNPRHREAETYGYALTSLIPPGSTLLTSSDVEFRPLWFMRIARNFRPDLRFQIIDQVDEQVMSQIAQDLTRRPVFGTLIYPDDLREKLAAQFQLVPWGFLTRILPKTTTPMEPPKEMNFPLALPLDQETSLLFSGIVEIPRQPPERPLRNGDVLFYSYIFEGNGKPLPSKIVAPVLLDENGSPFRKNGVILGHDIHRLADAFQDVGVLATGSRLFSRRTVAIPLDLPPGEYELKVAVQEGSDTELASFRKDRLEGVNLLNEDGFTEVFKLKNGISGKTFWNFSGINQIGKSISLGKFKIFPQEKS